MRREYRLTRGADFERVRANRRSWSHPFLVCSVARRDGGEPARVGIVAGRRVGKAVVRNRVKRRLREIMRARYDQLLRGYDLVLIARAPAAEASLTALAEAVDSLLARARLRTTSSVARRASGGGRVPDGAEGV